MFIFSAGMHVIKRLMVNYDTLRLYQIFSGYIFDICSHLASRDFQSYGAMRSQPAVTYMAYLL